MKKEFCLILVIAALMLAGCAHAQVTEEPQRETAFGTETSSKIKSKEATFNFAEEPTQKPKLRTWADAARKRYAYALEVNRSKDGQFFLRLVASNGAIVMHGETMKNRVDAIEMARRLSDGNIWPLDCTRGRCQEIES